MVEERAVGIERVPAVRRSSAFELRISGNGGVRHG